jgi:SMODS-associated and fused to various effectors sensor domain
VPFAVETVDGAFRRARRSLSLRERLPFVGVRPRRRWGPRGTGAPLAVCVEVSEFAGLPTFREWLAANRSAFGRSIVLTRTGHHDPERGKLMATSVAAAIRDAARMTSASEVLLFPHISWPLAVLLGAALNTLTVRIFEWDNSVGPPVYVEVATLRAGIGGSPMVEVHT